MEKKWVEGTVVTVNNTKTKKGRTSCSLTIDFVLHPTSVVKRATVNLRSVRAGNAPSLHSSPANPVDWKETKNLNLDFNTFREAADDSLGTDNSTVNDNNDTEEEVEDDRKIPARETVTQNDSDDEETEIIEEENNDNNNDDEETDGSIVEVEAQPVRRSPRHANQPNVIVNNTNCFCIKEAEVIVLKGINNRKWRMKNQFGDDIYEGCPEAFRMSRLDFFLCSQRINSR